MISLTKDIAKRIEEFEPLADVYARVPQTKHEAFLQYALQRTQIPKDVLVYSKKIGTQEVMFELTVEAGEIITDIKVRVKYGRTWEYILKSGKCIRPITSNPDYLITPYELNVRGYIIKGTKITSQYTINNYDMSIKFTGSEGLSIRDNKNNITPEALNILLELVQPLPNTFVFPDKLVMCGKQSYELELYKLLYQLATINHIWHPSTHYIVRDDYRPLQLSDAILLPKN